MNWNQVRQAFVEENGVLMRGGEGALDDDAEMDGIIGFFTALDEIDRSRGEDAGESVTNWFY